MFIYVNIHLSWLNPQQQLTTTQMLLEGWGKENWKGQSKKTHELRTV